MLISLLLSTIAFLLAIIFIRNQYVRQLEDDLDRMTDEKIHWEMEASKNARLLAKARGARHEGN